MLKTTGLFNLFFELELSLMTEDFCTLLAKLLNDKLAKYLITFVDEEDTNPDLCPSAREGLTALKTITYPRAKILLLANELREWKTPWVDNVTVYDLLNHLQLEEAVYYSRTLHQRKGLAQILQYILSLENQITGVIEPREKTDAEAFQDEVADIARMSNQVLMRHGAVDMSYNPSLASQVKANFSLFYSAGESARNTGLRLILQKLPDYRIILQGLEYNLQCDLSQISEEERRCI